jgi:hemolysin activation/secretion protein
MKKFLFVALISSSSVFAFGIDSHALRAQKLCETIPADASQIVHTGNKDSKKSREIKVGTTESFLEGRNVKFTVNQHNGKPIVFSTSCEGKLIADTGPKLKGLIITTPQYFKNEMGGKFETPGYFVKDLPVLTDDSSIEAHYADYEDEAINEDLLNNVIRDTIVFMRDKNQPVVDVYFPEQDVTDGYIVALVKRAIAGKIIINGNEYYEDEEISRFVTTEPGKFIWSDDISKDLRWINSYPYRQTDVIFKPGEQTGTSDVIYETKDMYPFRIFGGVDNYGSKTTSQNQFFTGFSYGDLWDLDHEFIYTLGAGFDFANFNSHTIQYITPIPSLRHKLSFTGNISTSEPRASGLVSQEGTNTTLNADYEMPLYDWGFRGFTQSINFGIDWKRLENDVEFGGTSIFSSSPEIAQAYARYEGTKTSAKTLQTVQATVVSSPGDITGNNNEEAFEIARTGADPQYTYGKALYQGSYTESNTGLTFSTFLRGQISNEKLLSSEQATISGVGAVRGYSDNSVRRDNAFLSTVEVASPYVPVLDTILGSVFRDRVQGFVFYDKGTGFNKGDSGDRIELDSAGLGARFGLGNNLNGVVEYGREVKDKLDNGIDSKVHFRLNAAY